MAVRVHAVYENGHLRLLEPVELDEGQTVEVQIMTARERMLALLGDLAVQPAADEGVTDVSAEELMALVEELPFDLNLSQVILDEREQGW